MDREGGASSPQSDATLQQPKSECHSEGDIPDRETRGQRREHGTGKQGSPILVPAAALVVWASLSKSQPALPLGFLICKSGLTTLDPPTLGVNSGFSDPVPGTF